MNQIIAENNLHKILTEGYLKFLIGKFQTGNIELNYGNCKEKRM